MEKANKRLCNRKFGYTFDESKTQFLRYSYTVVTGVKKGSDIRVRLVTTRMSNGHVPERDIQKIAFIDSLDNKC